MPPDELRFNFDEPAMGQSWNPDAVKGMTIKSAQMGLTLKFGFWFQNNTAIEGVFTELQPEDFSSQMKAYWKEAGTEVKPFEASSPIFSIDEDFEVWHVPYRGAKAPVIVMFPDFRSFAHSSNNGLVSAGLAWGVFKFARCER